MIAQITGYKVGEFIHTSGDLHIYHNHFDAVQEQLTRSPRTMPTLRMPEFQSLNGLLQTAPDDYSLEGYDPHPAIKAPMAL